MKMTYRTANGRLTFELETSGGKQAFEIVAAMQELFEEPCCGKCQNKDIRFDVREYGGNKYYKMCCMACGAQMDFGQNKDGKGLFAKKWDKEQNKPSDNGGWYIYQRDESSSAGSNSRSQSTASNRPRSSGDSAGDDPIPF